jgi:hypothetical protein
MKSGGYRFRRTQQIDWITGTFSRGVVRIADPLPLISDRAWFECGPKRGDYRGCYRIYAY